MVRILFAIGNALMTLGSVIALGKKVGHFGKRVNYHNKPQYTKKSKPVPSVPPEPPPIEQKDNANK